jgi:YVTN family beta-propeller protein
MAMRSIARYRASVLLVVVGAVALAAALCAQMRKGDIATALETGDRAGPAEVKPTLATSPGAAQISMPSLFVQTAGREGIAVEFSIQHVDPSKAQFKEFQEGDDARVQFKITDTTTGRPVRSLNPAAWMDHVAKEEIKGAVSCEQKVKAFLGGSIFGRAELDLNVYNVLTLNDEATISVVDPLFGFGGTKLLDMVVLESPGEDWVLTSNESRVYVSLPSTKKIAVVDTAAWSVSRNIELDRRPGRILLHPDESVLVVADAVDNGADTEASAVTVVDMTRLESVARVKTGRGHHELAFNDDGSRLLVTNERDSTVSVIDARSWKKETDISVGAGPASIAFSPLAKMGYVSARDGTITVLDDSRGAVVTKIKADPGLGQIRFGPDSRLGFVVNSSKNVVYILDAATNRIVQTADVEDEPYQVTFSSQFAYVRHRRSENVLMLPLKDLGIEKHPVQVFSFPGGKIDPARIERPSPADTIVQAPGENAVLVASPLEKAVSYYREGMAAPAGNFSNYGRQPRAVLVVDHSLRERGGPGVYESVVRLRKPGDYDIVFFLNSPRLVHCFRASVKPNEALEAKRLDGRIKVEHIGEKRRVGMRRPAELRFRLTDQQSKAPVSALSDVEALSTLMPGIWHKRHVLSPEDDGVYVLTFTPPRPGFYYIYLQCLSHGLGFNNDQYLVLEAIDQDEAQR